MFGDFICLQGNSVIVTITVFDEDLRAGNANNEKIDYLQQMVTFVPDFNGKRNTILNYTLQGAVSRYVGTL